MKDSLPSILPSQYIQKEFFCLLNTLLLVFLILNFARDNLGWDSFVERSAVLVFEIEYYEALQRQRLQEDLVIVLKNARTSLFSFPLVFGRVESLP